MIYRRLRTVPVDVGRRSIPWPVADSTVGDSATTIPSRSYFSQQRRKRKQSFTPSKTIFDRDRRLLRQTATPSLIFWIHHCHNGTEWIYQLQAPKLKQFKTHNELTSSILLQFIITRSTIFKKLKLLNGNFRCLMTSQSILFRKRINVYLNNSLVRFLKQMIKLKKIKEE